MHAYIVCMHANRKHACMQKKCNYSCLVCVQLSVIVPHILLSWNKGNPSCDHTKAQVGMHVCFAGLLRRIESRSRDAGYLRACAPCCFET